MKKLSGTKKREGQRIDRERLFSAPQRPSGHYVYTLARPNGDVFYVGKGKGARAEEHIWEAERLDCICRKCRIIRHIWDKRQQVQISYVFVTDDPKAAFAKEKELITALAPTGKLTNKDHVPFVFPKRSEREIVKQHIKRLYGELAVRGTRKERRAEIERELFDLKQSIGDGWQRSFDLLENGPDFEWTDWLK